MPEPCEGLNSVTLGATLAELLAAQSPSRKLRTPSGDPAYKRSSVEPFARALDQGPI